MNRTSRASSGPRVVVLATGGTIASVSSAGRRGAVAARTAAHIVERMDFDGVQVEGRDILNRNSYLLTHRELRQIAEAVTEQLLREDVDGVVVTHGTDTMEESAYLADLVHDSDKPVVFTGAQQTADSTESDGPRNLRDAVAVAAAPVTRRCGVLIAFAGWIYPANRTRKQHTVSAAPFQAIDAGPIGRIDNGQVSIRAYPRRAPRIAFPDSGFDRTRVDVVVVYPGADAALPRASVTAGAHAVVLAGTGTGNGNHELLAWTREALASGIIVGLSTRVAEGPVIPTYGNGGGVDLADAGALVMGGLPLYHSRLLLALLLAADRPLDQQTIDAFTT